MGRIREPERIRTFPGSCPTLVFGENVDSQYKRQYADDCIVVHKLLPRANGSNNFLPDKFTSVKLKRQFFTF